MIALPPNSRSNHPITGRVYRGQLPVIHERPERELTEIRRWRA